MALAGQATALEALQTGIGQKLAALDDPAVTGVGQSAAQLPGIIGKAAGGVASRSSGARNHSPRIRGRAAGAIG